MRRRDERDESTIMGSLIASRLIQFVGTVLVASFLVFAVMEFSPGNVARKTLGPFATDEQVAFLTEKLRLADPLMVRYGRWLGTLLGLSADRLSDPELNLGYSDPRGERYFGNFGFSMQMKRPVSEVLWDRLGHSLLLASLSFALIVPLAIGAGIVCARHEGGSADRAIMLVGTVFASIPEFASGVILVAILVVLLGLLPGTSPLEPSGSWPLWTQLVLPVLVLTFYVTAYVMRFVRTAFIEVLGQPYIRTAYLKGLKDRQVIFGHAFRNAIIIPFTVILLQINWLLSGVVVTEAVFAYPGIGRMLLEAALFGDIAVIEAVTLITVALAAFTQLAGDIGYALLNPRILVR